MPLALDIHTEDGVAIGVADGPISVEAAKLSAVDMWGAVEGPRIRILWDLRRSRFEWDISEVRDFAQFVKRGAPPVDIRTAFVVGGELEFGLVRMFEVFREEAHKHTSVFWEIEAAMEWLRTDSIGS